MNFEEYCEAAKELAAAHGVDRWLWVQVHDWHCRFDDYPPAAIPSVTAATQDLFFLWRSYAKK
jgi:hypothetical protein